MQSLKDAEKNATKLIQDARRGESVLSLGVGQ
jgi:hypothetical protein